MFRIFTDIADALTYNVFGLAQGDSFAASVHFFIEDTGKIFVMMTVLLLGVGFLRTWVSPVSIRRWLGQKGFGVPYVLAVMLGALTPFCSCSSLPLFMAFVRAGVPFGVTMAFLITSPMVNEVAAVLFGQAIGWDFTLAYALSGMAVGLLGGVLIDRLKLEKWLEPFARGEAEDAAITYPDMRARARAAWHETRSTLKSVWGYVVIGVEVGALIHGYVPQDWFYAHAGAGNFWAVPLAVVAGIPLYASCTGMVPVADALISKGLPAGTTLAFIMSTTAISFPELMILRRMLKPQMLVWFVCYLALAFLVVGYIFNAVF